MKPLPADRTALAKVTPRVGEWIETNHTPGVRLRLGVTPRVGVWIETEICKINVIT